MQVLEYRVNALGHLRHPGKDLFFGVAIDQHAGTPPCACFFFYPYSLTSPAFFHTVTFPSLVHMVSSRSTGPISHRILVLQSHLRKKRGKMGEGVRSYECRTTNGARSERGGGRAERHQLGSRPAGRAVWWDRVTCSTCRGEKARWALLARAARAGGAQERLADGRGTGTSQRPRGAAAVGGSGLG